MPAGRPTNYTPEIVEKSIKYITDYPNVGDVIPSVVGLAGYIDIARSTINRWRDEEGKEEFKDILDKINETQQKVLINKGLSSEFNSNITKLVLGKHGFHDKVENETNMTVNIDHEDLKTL